MFTPKVFRDDVFEDLFGDLSREFRGIDRRLYGRHAEREMLTDVREHEDSYELEIDLPGFKKDQLQIELTDGTLTITASKGLDKDEKDHKGRLIRQERYAGVLRRSFYVGEEITPEDVTAKFEDGVLKLTVPKKQPVTEEPKKSLIHIG